MSKKLTLAYIEKSLSNMNLKWLNKDDGYKDNKTKIKLQCINNNCNYVWYAPFRSIIKSKYGCHRCAGREKYNIKDVAKILNDKNMILLDNKYINNITSLNLKCKICNHVWINSFNNIKGHSQGCPKCAGTAKPSNEEVFNLLKKKKIIWLDSGKGYLTSLNIMSFKCETCQHEWRTNFSSINNQDSGCPKCVNCVKYDLNFVKSFCENKKITVLSKEYREANKSLIFTCNVCKYQWNTNFSSIKNKNSGCPNCSSCKTEKLCRAYLEKKLNMLFPKISTSWTKGLQLDGYNEKLNLAFEYNGLQHFKLVPFYHKTKEDFKSQQVRDKLKRKILKQRRIKLLDIPYTYSCQKPDKLYKFIDDQLLKLKII